jgi:hypothetical protein
MGVIAEDRRTASRSCTPDAYVEIGAGARRHSSPTPSVFFRRIVGIDSLDRRGSERLRADRRGRCAVYGDPQGSLRFIPRLPQCARRGAASSVPSSLRGCNGAACWNPVASDIEARKGAPDANCPEARSAEGSPVSTQAVGPERSRALQRRAYFDVSPPWLDRLLEHKNPRVLKGGGGRRGHRSHAGARRGRSARRRIRAGCGQNRRFFAR